MLYTNEPPPRGLHRAGRSGPVQRKEVGGVRGGVRQFALMDFQFLRINSPLLIRFAVTASLLIVSLCCEARQADSPPPLSTPRITLLIIPGLRADDLVQAKLPALTRLINEGESGWMVCRAARPADPDQLRPDGRETIDSLMLSLGCGGRARCGPEADGIVSPTPHNLHVLPYPPPGSLDALKKANTGLGYTVQIGALGDIAHSAGIATAVIGNMDSDRPDRSGYFMAMDSHGRVDDAGSRMGKVIGSDTAPFGITADIDQTLAAYDGVAERDHLRVLVAGELYRADRYMPLCLQQIAALHRENALNNINRLVEQILSRIQLENAGGAASRLIVLSPGPADSTSSAQDTLAPIILYGSGIPHGSITSLSTHRAALVVNTDLLATIAEWLHEPLPHGATGRPIMLDRAKAAEANKSLRGEHNSYVDIAIVQNILGGLPTVQVFLLLVGFAASRWRPASRSSAAIRSSIAACIVSLPLGMLVLPAFHLTSPVIASICLFVFSVVCMAFAALLPDKPFMVLTVLSGALITLVLADLLTGSRLLQNAWMSYSAADGSRFYGIGNEYMGAVIGALIILFPTFATRRTARATESDGEAMPVAAVQFKAVILYYLLFATMVLIMAAPFAGAKVGAIPSAGAAAASILLLDRRGRIAPKDLVVACLALLLILTMAAVIDSHGSQTHLIRSITGSGGDSISMVIRRKLGMELRLLKHSPWTVTLIVGAAILALSGRQKARLRFRQPVIARTMRMGLWWGACASLLFNDAGVLAAAQVMLYGCAWSFTALESNPGG